MIQHASNTIISYYYKYVNNVILIEYHFHLQYTNILTMYLLKFAISILIVLYCIWFVFKIFGFHDLFYKYIKATKI